MGPPSGLLGMLVVSIWLAAGSAHAQFNGNFEIERHFLDDENFLDWKAYQHPITWRYRWFTVANGLRGSVGSISQERFYVSQEIRLEADLGRYGTFLYHQEEESFFRPDPVFQEVELRFGETYYVSLTASPQHDKRLMHIGYALARGKRTDWQFVRFSHIDQFAFFNEKNKDATRFGRIPTMDRIQVRSLLEGRILFLIDLKRENSARFDEVDPNIKREYEGAEVDLTVDWWSGWDPFLPGDRVVGFTYSDDRERRTQTPGTADATLPDLRQNLGLRWLDLYWGIGFGEDDFLTVGYLDSIFENRIGSSFPDARFRTRLTTAQAYAVWEHDRREWLGWVFSLQAGLAELKEKKGADAVELGNEDSLQIKAGVGLVLAEADRYRILFNSTWDLDLISGRQWDGGNIQVQIYL